jgi:PPOX class probable F420-dependent enzyme
VPVCYALVADELVIAIDEKPKSTTSLARLRNIERDPHVSLLFDRYDEDWTKLAWVGVEGDASVLPLGANRPAALQALRQRYPQYREMDLESRPLIIIRPQRVLGWRWEGG